jgi:uncharacterized membrane protein YjdF
MLDLVKDLWSFMKVRKKFWLVPLITVLFVLTLLVVFASASPLAPFIYTLF